MRRHWGDVRGISPDFFVDWRRQLCERAAMSVPPFCIIGTPRSRTAWFARFLSHGAVLCEHEPSVQFASIEDMQKYFVPDRGASDSMLTLKWHELLAHGVKLLMVLRPRGDVLQSAIAAGLATANSTAVLDHIIAATRRVPQSVPRWNYSDLTIRACADIFFECYGEAPPSAWLYHWYGTTVEADISSTAMQAHRNAKGLKSFYHELQGTD